MNDHDDIWFYDSDDEKLSVVPVEFRPFVSELLELSPDVGVGFTEVVYEFWRVRCYSRRGQELHFQMERDRYSLRYPDGEEISSGKSFPSRERLHELLV